MKSTIASSVIHRLRLLVLLQISLGCGLGSAQAQSNPQNASQPGNASQQYSQQRPGYGGYQDQRPGVGEAVGGFIKRLFYGEPQPAYTSQSQSRNNARPGRSLDAPPSAYRQLSAAKSDPAPASPPAPASTKKSTVADSGVKPRNPATTSIPEKKPTETAKYSPPRIKSEPPVQKQETRPAPMKEYSAPPAPMPPPPAPSEPQISAPAPLNNKPSEPPSTIASLNNTLPGADITPITPPSSIITPKENAPASTSSSSAGQFLVGKKTAVPGRVISPYPPYQELDISGLTSGSLALDPTTDKVFEIP